MTNWKRFTLLSLLGGIFAGSAWCQNLPIERSWTSITDKRLQNPQEGEWISYRRSYDVTAFSPLRRINTANVRELRPVWSYSMRDNNRWFPTPIAVNGMLFVPEGSGRLLAFDAVTGDVIWIHERRFPADISISEAFARARGVAVYKDKIYWGTADAHLLALDAKTGTLVWDIQTGDYHTGEGLNHPPLIADGKVFVGHAGGDRTAHGRFRAFDAETGALLWTVYTAPRPGDPGYESWSHTKFPPLGAAPWNTASYDPRSGLVYFGTGNPAPWTEAARGAGDALFSNSILAVEAATGKIRWHFQVLPRDDYDGAAYESMLVDLTIEGRKRKALIETNKMGWGVVLDRDTGEFLKSFRTGYDNRVTGWTQEGRPILNPDLKIKPEDVDSGRVFHVCPHAMGVRNLNSPSFSPLTQLYYLPVNNSCMNARSVSVEYQQGHSIGGAVGEATLAPGYDHVGEFVAFDPVTGDRVWTYIPPSGAAMSASALSTAGGLVFGGTVDRDFFALDATSGKLLWHMRLSGDISGAPVTFTEGGRQFLAIATGGRPGPTTFFAPLTKVHLAEGSGTIWVFALPDERDLQPGPHVQTPTLTSTSGPVATAQPAELPPTKDSLTQGTLTFTAAQATRGEDLFSHKCVKCHAIADQSGESLRSKWGKSTLAQWFSLISVGMPGDAPGSLSKDDYAAIMAYLLSQSGYEPGSVQLPADIQRLEKLRLGAQPGARAN
jgi:alcohol dehydrogenase (cytochrome c)